MFSAACAVDYSITVAAGPEEETSDGTAKVLLFIIISQIHANGLPHFAGTCPIKQKSTFVKVPSGVMQDGRLFLALLFELRVTAHVVLGRDRR